MRLATAHVQTDLPDDTQWNADDSPLSPGGQALTSQTRSCLAGAVTWGEEPLASDNEGWAFAGAWNGQDFWFEVLCGNGKQKFRLCVTMNKLLRIGRSRELTQLAQLCNFIGERLRPQAHVEVLGWTLFEDRWWIAKPFDGPWDPTRPHLR